MTTSADRMSKLHEMTTQAIEDGLASTDLDTRLKALTAAIKFLKDNGIESAPGTNKKLNDIAQSLPFSGEDEDDGAIPFPSKAN